MRTYAPAPAIEVLERLLQEPSLARGVVHHEVRPALEATYGDWTVPEGKVDHRYGPLNVEVEIREAPAAAAAARTRASA